MQIYNPHFFILITYNCSEVYLPAEPHLREQKLPTILIFLKFRILAITGDILSKWMK